jgi:hypothetical protein
VSLNSDQGDGASIGVKVRDEAALQEIGERLLEHGLSAAICTNHRNQFG